MAETSSRDLFPGALEMMILQSLRRQPVEMRRHDTYPPFLLCGSLPR
jgi:hypothetical protein